MKNLERVYKMSFASVYPHYIAKAEKKNRTKEEVDQIIFWLRPDTMKKRCKNTLTRKLISRLFLHKQHFIQMLRKLPALSVVIG